MATHSSVLAEESHEQRRLAGHGPWGRRESDTTEVTKHACTSKTDIGKKKGHKN